MVNDVFQQFMQEKHETCRTKAPEVEQKLTAFEKFSKNMDFLIEEPTNLKNTKKKTKDTYEKVKLNLEELTKSKSELQQVLSNSIVLQPGFNELKTIPSQVVNDKKLKLQRKVSLIF